MALGERLNFFRRKCNLTMNALGRMLGFDPKSADVRISQYEKDAKMPKEELIHSMADVLGISPMALKLPNIDSYDALMHTLFALEDIYGLTVSEEDGKVSLYLNPEVSKPGGTLSAYFLSWAKQKDKLVSGEITLDQYDDWRYNFPKDALDQYDDWRYNFPKDDDSVIRAKAISPQLSDDLLQGLASGELTIQEAPKKRKTRRNFERKGMPGQSEE